MASEPVKLFTTDGVAAYWLPRFLSAFFERCPDVELRSYTAEDAEAYQRAHYDLAIHYMEPKRSPPRHHAAGHDAFHSLCVGLLSRALRPAALGGRPQAPQAAGLRPLSHRQGFVDDADGDVLRAGPHPVFHQFQRRARRGGPVTARASRCFRPMPRCSSRISCRSTSGCNSRRRSGSATSATRWRSPVVRDAVRFSRAHLRPPGDAVVRRSIHPHHEVPPDHRRADQCPPSWRIARSPCRRLRSVRRRIVRPTGGSRGQSRNSGAQRSRDFTLQGETKPLRTYPSFDF